MSNQVPPTDLSPANDRADEAVSAYEQGYRAYGDDIQFEWCPYAPGRAAYSAWARGWLQAESNRYGE